MNVNDTLSRYIKIGLLKKVGPYEINRIFVMFTLLYIPEG